ncbi:hypothetical protein ACJMK2_006666 [Sinanodonta woodiana]|uniref:Uncharacterized protein n=1 Tax=Sinanodonta woodiana TaxID=1069815 RepID=A0ABD3VWZ9_SINWO
MNTTTNMFAQESVMDSRFESDHFTGGSVNNDKGIALVINPYNHYNNRFSEGENSQHSDNQNRPPVKERKQKSNFIQCDTDNLGSSLSQSNLAENDSSVNGFQNGHNPICIPLKVDGSISLIPSENNQGYTKLYDIVSKSDLTRKGHLEQKSQNGMSNHNFSKQKIDEEAIVDVAANKHNRLNRMIHDLLWCPFILIFVFFCFSPAILLMHKSDIAFRKGRDSKARRWAICSSVFYGIGLVLTLAFYATIITLVIIFVQYNLF